MATTVARLIEQMFEDAGIKSQGVVLSAERQNRGLEILNDLLDEWSTQKLMVYEVKHENFPLVIGQNSYTIGTGGNFNTSRPFKLSGGYIRDAQNNDYPVEVIDLDQYNRIANKGVSNRPDKVYHEPSYPLATLLFNFKPTIVESVFLDMWKPLTAFSSAAVDVDFPPGYRSCLRYNGALRLMAGKTVDPVVASLAASGLALLGSANDAEERVEVDTALRKGRGFNINSG